MHDHLRRAAGAGSRHDPLGGQAPHGSLLPACGASLLPARGEKVRMRGRGIGRAGVEATRPLTPTLSPRAGRGGRRRSKRFERQAAGREDVEANRRRSGLAVINERVRLGVTDQRVEAAHVEAGRTQHDAARKTVEFDQRRRRLGHVADGEDDRAPFETGQVRAQAGRGCEIVEGKAPVARRDSLGRGPRRRPSAARG